MDTTNNLDETRSRAFSRYGALGPFSDAMGELWVSQRTDGTFLVRTTVSADHANNLGVPHGGFLCTLADNAMGACLRRSTGHRYVTVNLGIDFIGRAAIGAMIEVACTVRKTGKRLCFVECWAMADDRAVFSAKGIFHRIDTDADAAPGAASSRATEPSGFLATGGNA